jgi:hypothetical protein
MMMRTGRKNCSQIITLALCLGLAGLAEARGAAMANGTLVGKPRLVVHGGKHGASLSHRFRPGPAGSLTLTAEFKVRPTEKPAGGWSLAEWNGSLARTVSQYVSVTVPAGVARKLIAAAGDAPASKLRISTTNTPQGMQVRLVAGEGKKVVIVDKTAYSGSNGETGVGRNNVVRVQEGMGKAAKAYFVGYTSVTALDFQTFEATGRSSLFRSGGSKVVDPVTLEPTNTVSFSPTVGPDKSSTAGNWLMRPTRRLTHDLDSGLSNGRTNLPWTVPNMAMEGLTWGVGSGELYNALR